MERLGRVLGEKSGQHGANLVEVGAQNGNNLASKIHQNLLLDGSWAVLWPSWAVLGRLGGLLRRLEEASKNDAKKECTKSRQKMRLQASLANLGGVRLWTCYGEAVQSGPLNYHLPFTIHHCHLPFTIYHLHTPLPLTIYHLLFNPHLRRRAKRGGGYQYPYKDMHTWIYIY